jgi:hypothetical protein
MRYMPSVVANRPPVSVVSGLVPAIYMLVDASKRGCPGLAGHDDVVWLINERVQQNPQDGASGSETHDTFA